VRHIATIKTGPVFVAPCTLEPKKEPGATAIEYGLIVAPIA